MRKTLTLILLSLVVSVAVASVRAQSPRDPEVELRAAQYQERIKGDVAGAIATYQRLATNPDRSVAGAALLALADAYERAGRADARATLERVSRDFSETESGVTARRRLESQRSAGPTQRMLLNGPEANEVWGSVSPDGRYLPFQDPETGNVAVRDLSDGRVRVVSNSKGYEEGFTEGAIVWSPNGNELAYSWWHDEPGQPSRMQLRVVARENGKPRILYQSPQLDWMQPFAWSSDGRFILAVLDLNQSLQLGLVRTSDGSFQPLTSGRNPTRAGFSPDGRYVVFDYSISKEVPMRDINIIGIDGKNERALVSSPDDDFLLDWLPDGRHVLFGSDRRSTPGAWAIAVADGRPEGEPISVKVDIGRTSSLGFDKRGRFFTLNDVAGNDVTIAELDPATGKMTQQARPAPKGQPLARRSMGAWSQDGRRLIYTQSIQGRGTTLVVQNIATGELTIRPTVLSNIFRPTFFPDGNSVLLLAHDLDGKRGVFKVDLRSGEHTALLKPVQNFAFLTRNGEAFGYVRDGSLVLRRIADGNEQVLTKAQSGTLVISPDGQSIARFVGTSIVVSPASGGADRVVLEKVPGGSRRLAWSHDSQHIFFTSGDAGISRVPAAGGAAMDTGIRAPLTLLINVSPDGRRLVMSGGVRQAEVWLWENVVPRAR